MLYVNKLSLSLLKGADLGITGGYQDDAWCEGSECTGTVDWSDLQKKIGIDDYWTTDAVNYDSDTGMFTLGTNNNSCSAFYVDLSHSQVAHYGRYSGTGYGYHALCE